MNINFPSLNYRNNIPKNHLSGVNESKSNKENTITTDKNKNSNKINTSSPYPSGMIPTDKGTAIGTTINVDRNTIFNIINYAVSNTETSGFEEMGMDDNKRWVVINGQRFECELTPEEKELIRKAKERNNLFAYINEAEAKAEKYKIQEKETVQINFDEDRTQLSHDTNNPKMQNLLNNDKVMTMLKSISIYSPIKLQL